MPRKWGLSRALSPLLEARGIPGTPSGPGNGKVDCNESTSQNLGGLGGTHRSKLPRSTKLRDYDNGAGKEEDERLKVTITYRNLPKLTMDWCRELPPPLWHTLLIIFLECEGLLPIVHNHSGKIMCSTLSHTLTMYAHKLVVVRLPPRPKPKLVRKRNPKSESKPVPNCNLNPFRAVHSINAQQTQTHPM